MAVRSVFRAKCAIPMMAFMGVRISWLIFARKSLLARVASSASSLARLTSASAFRRSWISLAIRVLVCWRSAVLTATFSSNSDVWRRISASIVQNAPASTPSSSVLSKRSLDSSDVSFPFSPAVMSLMMAVSLASGAVNLLENTTAPKIPTARMNRPISREFMISTRTGC